MKFMPDKAKVTRKRREKNCRFEISISQASYHVIDQSEQVDQLPVITFNRVICIFKSHHIVSDCPGTKMHGFPLLRVNT